MENITNSRIITEAARNQFESTFQMLVTLVEVCKDSVWYEYYNEIPFWYQVYHVTYFVDFWLRESYQEEEFKSMSFDERIPPEFEYEIKKELSITREDILTYLKCIHEKTNRIFDSLDDNKMATPIIEGQDQFTYTDVIMTQIRHVMYNIGYLNGILRNLGVAESDWYAYNEN